METIRETVLAAGPYDLIHAQYGYPTGFAAMEAACELGVPCGVDPGRRWALGRLVLRDP